jgi:ribonuclease P protein subunit RPR2
MKKEYFSKRQKMLKDVAKERILFFFSKSKEVFGSDPALANRYVSLARKYSTKYKVKFPRELKRQFCKHCYKLLVPGNTVRIRTHRGKVVYFCMNCKKFMRFVY